MTKKSEADEQLKQIYEVWTLIEKAGMEKPKSLLDSYELVKNCYALGAAGIPMMLKLTNRIKGVIVRSGDNSDELRSVYWNCMKKESLFLFESFMMYLEHKRPKEERFYQPRMKPLRLVAQGVQDLADDRLDELFVNLPPRTGKTTIIRLAMLWWGSRDPNLSNLYTAYSDKITKTFYNGLLEFISDPTYAYKDMFPANKVIKTNGDDETIELNRVKSYPTFTCRSIYGTLNGACDCTGLAVADDLLSGIEEALSADRLETTWGKFDNNFVSRIKKDQGAKLINMGTRWALADPQGRRMFLLQNNPDFADHRYRIISIPALNEKDESNFNYPFGVGFSTETYKQRRASFEQNADEASWFAQYQQEPIDRQGALFSSGNMRFYNGVLPEGDPDRVFMAVDEAFGGGDYVSAPVCYQYGDTYYIHDVVYNNGDKYVTRPLIADCIVRNNVQAVRFEETKTTAEYHEGVDEELRNRGYSCTLTTKAPSTQIAKRIRIFDKAPEIREMYFRDSNCRSAEYQRFISNLFEFKMEGRVKHDDAPDSMAQLCDMKLVKRGGTLVVNSPF